MAIIRAVERPLAGVDALRMALRCASEIPIAHADWAEPTPMGTIVPTNDEYSTAHSSTCIPPMDPPMTRSRWVTPSWSNTVFWRYTMSRMVISGKATTAGSEVGPVVP
jgi:hypothetical protein